MKNLGAKRWAIAEGYIPGYSHGEAPQLTSHEIVETHMLRPAGWNLQAIRASGLAVGIEDRDCDFGRCVARIENANSLMAG